MSTLSPLHERLLSIVGDQTYRSIAQRTGASPETVRRYLQGQAPSVDFLSAICDTYDINANWLFTGEGARNNVEQRAETLRASSPAELLAAIADALELLTSRIDRLERFVQRVETRFNTVEVKLRSVQPDGAKPSKPGSAPPAERATGTYASGTASASRARAIARAIPKRPPQDAD